MLSAMINFKRAYDKLIAYEGGYVNDPDDRGGETYKGISRKFHPNWCGWELVDEFKHNLALLKENEHRIEPCVEKFYLENYWQKIHGDALPYVIAEELFEQAVNLGIKKAVKHFQRALNILSKKDLLDDDGKFGIRTLSAAQDLLRGVYIRLCYNVLNIMQGSHYINLMLRNVTYRKYIGWFERISIIKGDEEC